MRSSLEAVFVAGEIVGIAGANQAIEEGRLAALGILGDLGQLPRRSVEPAAARGTPPARRDRTVQRRRP